MASLGTAPNNLGQAQLMLAKLLHVSVGSWCVDLGLTYLGDSALLQVIVLCLQQVSLLMS